MYLLDGSSYFPGNQFYTTCIRFPGVRHPITSLCPTCDNSLSSIVICKRCASLTVSFNFASVKKYLLIIIAICFLLTGCENEDSRITLLSYNVIDPDFNGARRWLYAANANGEVLAMNEITTAGSSNLRVSLTVSRSTLGMSSGDLQAKRTTGCSMFSRASKQVHPLTLPGITLPHRLLSVLHA